MARTRTGAAISDPSGLSGFMIRDTLAYRVVLALAIAYHDQIGSEIEEASLSEIVARSAGRDLGYPAPYRGREVIESVITDLIQMGDLALSEKDPTWHLTVTEAGRTSVDQDMVDRAQEAIGKIVADGVIE